MEQAVGDQPERVPRLRERVCTWLQNNSRFIFAAFAGAEGIALVYTYEPPEDPIERQVVEFNYWLGEASPDDFNTSKDF